MMTEAELAQLPVTISLEQAARAIGIGRDRAYALAREGRFPVRFLPGHGVRRRISKADLLRYLGAQQDQAAS